MEQSDDEPTCRLQLRDDGTASVRTLDELMKPSNPHRTAMTRLSSRRTSRDRNRCLTCLVTSLVLAFLLAPLPAGYWAALAASIDDTVLAKQVNVGGGRMLYLYCSGPVRPGRPTIILISGYHDSSDPWTQQDVLSLLPQATGPSVLPGLARTERVCAYDRPGTLRYIDGLPLTDRSTPVAQPRTVKELADELKALLNTAQVSGPYVLVCHSLGGLIGLFYARTFPQDVRGIVFVDAFSPTIPAKLGRLWPLYLSVLNPPSDRQPIASSGKRSNCPFAKRSSILKRSSTNPASRMPRTSALFIAAYGLVPPLFRMPMTCCEAR
jgi:pimeloyl-ACP methyl ester carboxylesterase